MKVFQGVLSLQRQLSGGLKRPRRGFTLLELMLVLVIVVLLGVFVLPAVSGATARGRVEHQVRSFLALARKARALAVSEGRAYVLVVDPDQRELRLARQRDPLAEAGDGDDPELEVPEELAGWAQPIPFADDVNLEVLEVGEGQELENALESGEPLHIVFQPSGATEAVRLVFLGPKDERRTVTVHPYLGLARIVTEEEDP